MSDAALVAVQCAPAARHWLGATRQARVLSVFGSACNLANQDDAVLSVMTAGSTLTPFALTVAASGPTPFASLDSASPVRLAGGELLLAGLRIKHSAARAWDSLPDWRAVSSGLENGGALARLAAICLHWPEPFTLLDLYRPAGASLLRPRFYARIQAGAAGLVRGLLARDADQAAGGARTLAGLGSGLTPAGDDFVVGVLLAAWAGLLGPHALPMAAGLSDVVAPLTTTLSAAYVRAAAAGECSAYWHALFAALLSGDDAQLQTAAEAVLSVGHSSGADALAGFLATTQGLLEKLA